jgi:hypothetical protein
MSASFADTALLRFLFAKSMQPLIGDIMCWAHSTEQPSAVFLASHAHAVSPEHLRVHTEEDRSHLGACGLPHPLPQATVCLPSFLQPLHEAILLSGYQLRFLARTRAMAAAVESYVRSAEQQARLVRATVRTESHEPPTSSDMGAGLAASTCSGTVQERWLTGLGWQATTVRALRRLSSAGARERQALMASALSDLRARRNAVQHEALAEQLAQLQRAQAAAVAREQAQQAAAEEARLQRVEAMRAARAEADAHDTDPQVWKQSQLRISHWSQAASHAHLVRAQSQRAQHSQNACCMHTTRRHPQKRTRAAGADVICTLCNDSTAACSAILRRVPRRSVESSRPRSATKASQRRLSSSVS